MEKSRSSGFGFWTLTFLVVANMIGAGVFTTSGYTLASLGSPGLVMLAWLVAGLIALSGAYSYGLLIKRFPVSGGEYAFLSAAGYPFLGFVAGWVSLLAGFSGAIAFAALALEEHLPWNLPDKIPAVMVVILGAMAHGAKKGVGAATQNLTVVFKLVLLVVILGYGGWKLISVEWEGAVSGAPLESPTLMAFAGALVWISLSYSGFNAAVYVTGESKSPEVVARSLFTGTCIVILFYLLLNGLFVMAPPAELVSGQADVAALAAGWIGGEGFEQFVRVVISLALLTSILSMMMAGPRVYGKMAEDGLLPKVFMIRPDRVWPAVFLQTGVSLLLVFAGSLQELLSFLGLTLSLSAAASVLCLFLRKNRKELKGWRALPPVLFVSATLSSAVLLLIHDPWQGAGTVVIMVVGALGYLFLRNS